MVGFIISGVGSKVIDNFGGLGLGIIEWLCEGNWVVGNFDGVGVGNMKGIGLGVGEGVI
jgi:hypothetical protein